MITVNWYRLKTGQTINAVKSRTLDFLAEKEREREREIESIDTATPVTQLNEV
jgi:hypothetical protein